MIIYWQSNIGGDTRPHPHVYLGLGLVSLRISSPIALFNYVELSHLITLELNQSLIDLEI